MRRSIRCQCRVGLLCSLLAAGAASAGGCGGPQQVGFNANDPGAKLAAIIEAGREKDRSAIPHLIEQLESDDQAVRMYAILALERITGTRRGYRYYAPPAERQNAIRRWVRAYRDGQPNDDDAAPAKAVGEGEQPTAADPDPPSEAPPPPQPQPPRAER